MLYIMCLISKCRGCEKVFEEEITGTKINKTELEKVLEQLRPGDIIIVTELTRLLTAVKLGHKM